MKRLRGTNRIREFRKIAERIKSQIVKCEGVSGIVFTGALTRGFADGYSDVDVIVLLKERSEQLREKIKKIGSYEQRHSGIDVDLEVHFFEDLESRKWNEMVRWDFSHSEIVFDPERRTRGLIEKNLRVPERFWLRRIVVCGEYVRWYCCPVGKNVGTVVETWVDRGDLVSAHYCLSYALTLLVRVVFALNREFLPPPKWEIFCSYSLKWLPPDYRKLLGEALTIKGLTEHELHRRLAAARELWSEILPKIKDETGLTPKSISRQYVKRVLRQG
jgi:predicted nucleotidyltransferase